MRSGSIRRWSRTQPPTMGAGEEEARPPATGNRLTEIDDCGRDHSRDLSDDSQVKAAFRRRASSK